MDKLVINGPIRLEGKVAVSGAKNAALKLMAASLLTEGTTVLHNVPRIQDVQTMAAVLRTLGLEVKLNGVEGDVPHILHLPVKEGPKNAVSGSRSLGGSLSLTPPKNLSFEAPYELVSRMRASIMVLGPLLARTGRARVAMPGGCNIGNRKIDLHLRGLELLGATLRTEGGFIEGWADSLKGTEIILDLPSVGATENILMAAVLAEGRTVIKNAAREPEIVDLAHFLTACGARIQGAGMSEMEVEGVSSISGTEYPVMPDRVEAGTFLIAGAITGGRVEIEGGRLEDLELVASKLKDMGVEVEETSSGLIVSSSGGLSAVDVVTLPYPGFPTDLQGPMTALLSLSQGTSIVTENVFESRFIAIDELNRMGTDIRTEGHHAVIRGVERLVGAPVRAPDLRGGAALILAGLAAHGETTLYGVHHIDRGYERLEEKLRGLGASVERAQVEEDRF